MTGGRESDPYDALGVPRDASDADIRKAFRQLARVHHPDRDGGDHEKMAEANRAYEILTDPERRARYDATGSNRQPPAAEVRARDVLFRLMIDVMGKLPEEADLAAAIRSTLANLKRQVTRAIVEMQIESRRLDRRRQKLQDGGFFAGLFEQRTRDLAEKVKNAEDEIEVLNCAEEIMKGVTWTGDSPPPQLFMPDAAGTQSSAGYSWGR